jgi:hypothetical protein
VGKHSTGQGCLYIKKLDDVDLPTLRQMIERAAGQARCGAVRDMGSSRLGEVARSVLQVTTISFRRPHPFYDMFCTTVIPTIGRRSG